MGKTGPEQADVGRRAGRFVAGASGNPAGRPKGARNRTSALCADLLGVDAEAIMARLIRSAKKGEPVALRLAVERLVPVRAARDRAVEFELPTVGSAADLAQAAAAVIHHAAAGDITLSEAREFMGLIEGQRKVLETTDLVVRLEALEGQVGQGSRVGVVGPEAEELRARVRRLVEDRA